MIENACDCQNIHNTIKESLRPKPAQNRIPECSRKKLDQQEEKKICGSRADESKEICGRRERIPEISNSCTSLKSITVTVIEEEIQDIAFSTSGNIYQKNVMQEIVEEYDDFSCNKPQAQTVNSCALNRIEEEQGEYSDSCGEDKKKKGKGKKKLPIDASNICTCGRKDIKMKRSQVCSCGRNETIVKTDTCTCAKQYLKKQDDVYCRTKDNREKEETRACAKKEPEVSSCSTKAHEKLEIKETYSCPKGEMKPKESICSRNQEKTSDRQETCGKKETKPKDYTCGRNEDKISDRQEPYSCGKREMKPKESICSRNEEKTSDRRETCGKREIKPKEYPCGRNEDKMSDGQEAYSCGKREMKPKESICTRKEEKPSDRQETYPCGKRETKPKEYSCGKNEEKISDRQETYSCSKKEIKPKESVCSRNADKLSERQETYPCGKRETKPKDSSCTRNEDKISERQETYSCKREAEQKQSSCSRNQDKVSDRQETSPCGKREMKPKESEVSPCSRKGDRQLERKETCGKQKREPDAASCSQKEKSNIEEERDICSSRKKKRESGDSPCRNREERGSSSCERNKREYDGSPCRTKEKKKCYDEDIDVCSYKTYITSDKEEDSPCGSNWKVHVCRSQRIREEIASRMKSFREDKYCSRSDAKESSISVCGKPEKTNISCKKVVEDVAVCKTEDVTKIPCEEKPKSPCKEPSFDKVCIVEEKPKSPCRPNDNIDSCKQADKSKTPCKKVADKPKSPCREKTSSSKKEETSSIGEPPADDFNRSWSLIGTAGDLGEQKSLAASSDLSMIGLTDVNRSSHSSWSNDFDRRIEDDTHRDDLSKSFGRGSDDFSRGRSKKVNKVSPERSKSMNRSSFERSRGMHDYSQDKSKKMNKTSGRSKSLDKSSYGRSRGLDESSYGRSRFRSEDSPGRSTRKDKSPPEKSKGKSRADSNSRSQFERNIDWSDLDDDDIWLDESRMKRMENEIVRDSDSHNISRKASRSPKRDLGDKTIDQGTLFVDEEDSTNYNQTDNDYQPASSNIFSPNFIRQVKHGKKESSSSDSSDEPPELIKQKRVFTIMKGQKKSSDANEPIQKKKNVNDLAVAGPSRINEKAYKESYDDLGSKYPERSKLGEDTYSYRDADGRSKLGEDTHRSHLHGGISRLGEDTSRSRDPSRSKYGEDTHMSRDLGGKSKLGEDTYRSRHTGTRSKLEDDTYRSRDRTGRYPDRSKLNEDSYKSRHRPSDAVSKSRISTSRGYKTREEDSRRRKHTLDPIADDEDFLDHRLTASTPKKKKVDKYEHLRRGTKLNDDRRMRGSQESGRLKYRRDEDSDDDVFIRDDRYSGRNTFTKTTDQTIVPNRRAYPYDRYNSAIRDPNRVHNDRDSRKYSTNPRKVSVVESVKNFITGSVSSDEDKGVKFNTLAEKTLGSISNPSITPSNDRYARKRNNSFDVFFRDKNGDLYLRGTEDDKIIIGNFVEKSKSFIQGVKNLVMDDIHRMHDDRTRHRVHSKFPEREESQENSSKQHRKIKRDKKPKNTRSGHFTRSHTLYFTGEETNFEKMMESVSAGRIEEMLDSNESSSLIASFLNEIEKRLMEEELDEKPTPPAIESKTKYLPSKIPKYVGPKSQNSSCQNSSISQTTKSFSEKSNQTITYSPVNMKSCPTSRLNSPRRGSPTPRQTFTKKKSKTLSEFPSRRKDLPAKDDNFLAGRNHQVSYNFERRNPPRDKLDLDRLRRILFTDYVEDSSNKRNGSSQSPEASPRYRTDTHRDSSPVTGNNISGVSELTQSTLSPGNNVQTLEVSVYSPPKHTRTPQVSPRNVAGKVPSPRISQEGSVRSPRQTDKTVQFSGYSSPKSGSPRRSSPPTSQNILPRKVSPRQSPSGNEAEDFRPTNVSPRLQEVSTSSKNSPRKIVKGNQSSTSKDHNSPRINSPRFQESLSNNEMCGGNEQCQISPKDNVLVTRSLLAKYQQILTNPNSPSIFTQTVQTSSATQSNDDSFLNISQQIINYCLMQGSDMEKSEVVRGLVQRVVNEAVIERLQKEMHQIIADLFEKDKQIMDLHDLVTMALQRLVAVFNCLHALENRAKEILDAMGECKCENAYKRGFEKLSKEIKETTKKLQSEAIKDFITSSSSHSQNLDLSYN